MGEKPQFGERAQEDEARTVVVNETVNKAGNSPLMGLLLVTVLPILIPVNIALWRWALG